MRRAALWLVGEKALDGRGVGRQEPEPFEAFSLVDGISGHEAEECNMGTLVLGRSVACQAK